MTPLAPQIVLANTGDIVSYRLGRLDAFDDPRLLLVGVAAAATLATLFVAWIYRHESTALPRYASLGLAALRLMAFAGAIVFFLDPLKRADQQIVTESRVAVLVDASQSMAVEDETIGSEKGADAKRRGSGRARRRRPTRSTAAAARRIALGVRFRLATRWRVGTQ